MACYGDSFTFFTYVYVFSGSFRVVRRKPDKLTQCPFRNILKITASHIIWDTHNPHWDFS
jgi:hypothetical protein